MPDSALASALKAAGIRSPRDRLNEIATAALERHPRTLDAARAEVLGEVQGEADLLWVLFERWHGPAVDLLLQAMAQKQRDAKARSDASTRISQPSQSGARGLANAMTALPQRPGGLSAGPTHTAREEARGHVARVISKLDTFRIFDGKKPIGDCTPEEAMGWRAARVKEARFVNLLCSGLPPGRPVRDFIRPEEAELLWQQAMRETANE